MALIMALGPVAGQMQQAVEKIKTEYNLMGLSVVAVCDGRIAGEWYAGLRDYDRNLPVNENTKYRIASISKFVMTTAMMKLYDQKRLDLDEDVSTYLGFNLRNPNHPDTPITVRMLLTHTSSINEGDSYDPFLMASYNNVSNPMSFSELLVTGGKYYASDTWRKEAPGEYFTYCNANFGLAGTIIEKISGSASRSLSSRVFSSAGHKRFVISEGITDINNLAVIYGTENGMWVPGTDNYKGDVGSARLLRLQNRHKCHCLFTPGRPQNLSKGTGTHYELHMNNGNTMVNALFQERVQADAQAHFISTNANSDDEGVRG